MTSVPPADNHIHLLTDLLHGDTFAKEEVDATPRPDGTHKLEMSPSIAFGAAEGDIIRLEENGAFEVVEWGGNVVIHFLATKARVSEAHVATASEVFRHQPAAIDRARTCVIVATVDLVAVKKLSILTNLANATVTKLPDYVWQYGNVFDPSGHPHPWLTRYL